MNNDIFISRIAEEQNINNNQVQAVASLLAEGATIPFIARYRKEATGSLDEIVVAAVRDRLNQLKELEERKLAIIKSLEKHDHLTDELQERILAVESRGKLGDVLNFSTCFLF
ncbi:MAG: Tex-like N-terminal domain-containing protein [Thermodesulfobacteriota bacterium]|nr:Tex-like N-terminal domain-containing protein [Thermodesulfobacteriota bacterium]